MLLSALLDRYTCEHPYGISPGYRAQLAWTVSGFARHLGRPARLGDLAPQGVNAWIASMQDRLRPASVRSQRGNLLALWRWAYEVELTEVPPLRVRRLRPVRRAPQAWTIGEMLALVEAAAAVPGCFPFSDRRRGLWWESLIRCAYDSALRLGDLLALRWVDVARGQVTQHKTGDTVYFGLRNATRALVVREAELSGGGVLWPLWARREAFYGAFRQVVRSAGIRPGSFRWIRRTAVTQLERVRPGAGTILAGHRQRATTESYYLDRSQVFGVILPPWESGSPDQSGLVLPAACRSGTPAAGPGGA